jgi:hypothetical protein
MSFSRVCRIGALVSIASMLLVQAPASAVTQSTGDPTDAPAGPAGKTDLRTVAWDVGATTTTLTVNVDESTYGAGLRAALNVHTVLDTDRDGLADVEIYATRNADGVTMDMKLRTLDRVDSTGDCQGLSGKTVGGQDAVATTVTGGREILAYTFDTTALPGGLSYFRWAAFGQSPGATTSTGPWDYLPNVANPDSAAANPGDRRCNSTLGGIRLRMASGIDLDAVNPVALPATTSVPGGAVLGTSALPVRFDWAGSDNATPTGALRYDVEMRDTATGTWTAVVTNSSARMAIRSLTPAHTYQLRHRVRDAAGNQSAFRLSPTFRPSARQESAASPTLVYTGTWTSAARTGAYGGSVRTSTTAGATATLTLQGPRGVGVVMPQRADLGTAKVCLLQGATTPSCATIDLSPATATTRKLLFVRNMLNPSLSYKVRVTLMSGRVDLDAFELLA